MNAKWRISFWSDFLNHGPSLDLIEDQVLGSEQKGLMLVWQLVLIPGSLQDSGESSRNTSVKALCWNTKHQKYAKMLKLSKMKIHKWHWHLTLRCISNYYFIYRVNALNILILLYYCSNEIYNATATKKSQNYWQKVIPSYKEIIQINTEPKWRLRCFRCI